MPAELDQLLSALLEAGQLDSVDCETVRRGAAAQVAARARSNRRKHSGHGSLEPDTIRLTALELIANESLQSRRDGTPIDLEWLTRWTAEEASLPYQRVDPLQIDVASVTSVINHAYATRFNILPLRVTGKRVTIATGEPWVREWEAELSRTLNLDIVRVVANPATLRRYISEFYAVGRSLKGAAQDRRSAPVSSSGNFEALVDLRTVAEPDANDQHVVRIVDWLLQYAFEQRASDIHLEPRRENSGVRFRIDGVLHTVNEIPTPVMAAVISRVKALGRLDVIERRRPQDGRLKTRSPAGQEVELRLSTMPTAFGEKLVMRIFDPTVLVRSLEDLGLQGRDACIFETLIGSPHGMVIVTGPTGSGKTTTLYSTLKKLARPEINICTIEDPIEMIDPAINQMNVQNQIGLDFATGVRTLLRQDPDIIMVGEIRDIETATTAVQAALTGHLVLSTLHTNDAPSAINRLLDLGVAPYLLRSALLGVVAQRLVRTLCEKCKKPTSLDADIWTALIAPHRARVPRNTFTSVGCDECRRTGYKGRVGLYEIMLVDESIAEHIELGVAADELRSAALKSGLRPLRVSGAERVAAGLTTPEEVLKVVVRRALDVKRAIQYLVPQYSTPLHQPPNQRARQAWNINSGHSAYCAFTSPRWCDCHKLRTDF